MSDSVETFKVDPGFLGAMKIVSAIAGIAVCFSIYLGIAEYVVMSDMADNPMPVVLFSVILFLVFSSILAFCYRFVLRAEKDVVEVDADGLWFAHTGKEKGLVLWQNMASAKYAWIRRRMAIKDRSGHTCFSLSMQLTGFETLNKRISNCIEQNQRAEHQPEVFSRKPFFHATYALAFFLVIIAGVYLSLRFRWVAPATILCLLFLARDYLSTPHEVVLDNERMYIRNPVLKYDFKYEDIENMDLKKVATRPSSKPVLIIQVKGYEKPFIIKDIAAGTTDLFFSIQRRSGLDQSEEVSEPVS